MASPLLPFNQGAAPGPARPPMPVPPGPVPPPGVAQAGPQGRPPSPQGGPPLPVQGRPPLPVTGPQQPSGAPFPQPGAGRAPDQGRPPLARQQEAGPAPVPQAVQPQGLQINLDHIPDPGEMASLPPGAQIATPFGEIRNGQLVPNALTADRYRDHVVKRQEAFGSHPWASDPNAPKPPVRAFGRQFNPLTGTWS